jgi:hypothetical protein
MFRLSFAMLLGSTEIFLLAWDLLYIIVDGNGAIMEQGGKIMGRHRRVKIQGQTAIGGWHFPENFEFTEDEVLASLLRDAKAEKGQFWMVSEGVFASVRAALGSITVIAHKHNGRVQRFSVYVPKKLYAELRKAYAEDKLWME